jgi:hypothetical protein
MFSSPFRVALHDVVDQLLTCGVDADDGGLALAVAFDRSGEPHRDELAGGWHGLDIRRVFGDAADHDHT